MPAVVSCPTATPTALPSKSGMATVVRVKVTGAGAAATGTLTLMLVAVYPGALTWTVQGPGASAVNVYAVPPPRCATACTGAPDAGNATTDAPLTGPTASCTVMSTVL